MRTEKFLLFLLIFVLFQKPALAVDTVDAFTVNQKLGRGINLGNALEAPREGEWGVTLKAEYFQLIAEKGFDSVRIPIRWSAHAGRRAPYKINEKFFTRVDWAIENAQKNGLYAIINFHHYEELHANPQKERQRFLAMWEQVARRYKDYSEYLVFEILNEPQNNLTAEGWNTLLTEALTVIRKEDPERIVLIGTADWGGISALPKLKLPDDDRLILTIHYYNPFPFTHQGADWVEGQADRWLGTPWRGSYYEKKAIIEEFQPVIDYAREHKIPVNIGEFGANNKADMKSRALWTSFCARLFESSGFSWHYWEFCSGFGIYNPKTRRFYKELVDALLSADATLLELGEPAKGNGPEILRNGDFSSDKAHWTFGAWRAPAQAIAEVVDGELVVHVQKTGHEPWHIQLIQSNLTLEKGGSYILSFEARADRNRTISTSIDGDAKTNYTSFGGNTVTITPELKTYSLLVHINESINTGRVVFSFAQDNGLVYLDHISLKKYQ